MKAIESTFMPKNERQNILTCDLTCKLLSFTYKAYVEDRTDNSNPGNKPPAFI